MGKQTMTRRMLLKSGLASGAAPLALRAAGRDTAVAAENRRPGTLSWQLKHYSFDAGNGSGLRSPRLEGYCSATSVYPGDKLRFFVSTDPARKFTIDLYRTGYYGGQGGRHMAQLGPFSGEPQPIPMMGMERVRECAWQPAAEFTIPADWPSGVYLGKLALAGEPVESYTIFIVKSKRPAEILFQCSDLTWQAYNKWPGWDSLYDDGTPKRNNGYSYIGPHVRVSFDRPYAQYGQVHEVALSLGSGEYRCGSTRSPSGSSNRATTLPIAPTWTWSATRPCSSAVRFFFPSATMSIGRGRCTRTCSRRATAA